MITIIQYGEFQTFNHVHQYCLQDQTDLFVICRKEGNALDVIARPCPNVITLDAGNRVAFLYKASKLIRGKCVIVYFPGASILRVLKPRLKISLDLRSFTISDSAITRAVKDLIINMEAMLLGNILVLSNSMKAKLWPVIRSKSQVVPLGANPPLAYPQCGAREKKKTILYIGTFNKRNIFETIAEVDEVLSTEKDWEYTIIGRGSAAETERIIDAIGAARNRDRIRMLGEIKYPRLASYLAEATIGMCYIPLESQFQCQPPTKTLEYLAAKCFIVASATDANRELLRNCSSAVLIRNKRGEIKQALKVLIGKVRNGQQAPESQNVMSWQDVYRVLRATV